MAAKKKKKAVRKKAKKVASLTTKRKRDSRNGKSPSHPSRIEALTKKERTLNYRLDGWSQTEIARELDLSPSRISRMLNEILTEIEERAEKSIQKLRRIEVTRLERLIKAMSPAANLGDGHAVDRIVKLSDRRAKLLGLDAPIKTANVHEVKGLKKKTANQIRSEQLGLDVLTTEES